MHDASSALAPRKTEATDEYTRPDGTGGVRRVWVDKASDAAGRTEPRTRTREGAQDTSYAKAAAAHEPANERATSAAHVQRRFDCSAARQYTIHVYAVTSVEAYN